MDILHHDIGDMRARLAHFLVRFADADPCRFHINDKARNMRVFRQRLFRRPRHNQADFGGGRVGDVAFCAGELVTITIAHSHRLHGGTVRTTARLCQTKTSDFTAGDARQPLRLLFSRAKILNRAARHPDIDRHRAAIGGRSIADLLHRLDILADAHPRAAIFFRDSNAKQAHLAHFIQDSIGNAVISDHVILGRDQPFAHIAAQLVDKGVEDFGVHASIAHR